MIDAELLDDLGDEATLAFVAEGDADVGDELAGEGNQGHGRESQPGST